jgi:uncharacterized membrane protein YkgB
LALKLNNIVVARAAVFIVYFWFGVLKVLDLSPATPLVHALFDQTLAAWVEFGTFNLLFGLFECAIGVLFLFPRATKVAVGLLALHLITTAGPLVLLPSHTWSGFLVPSMEGQYILKNVLIISAAYTIYKSRKS